MKAYTTWILAAAILFAGCASSGLFREVSYTPGIYEGTGRGYRGPVHVRVQVSPGGIEDIVITRHRESVFPGLAAMEELLEAVLEHGSTDLDTVSGATLSSRGFLEAVENALMRARQ
ncbi:MAG: FMN-binding protein [Treponema sp.]|nr:FMN-binding protein [Treponema sp.]